LELKEKLINKVIKGSTLFSEKSTWKVENN